MAREFIAAAYERATQVTLHRPPNFAVSYSADTERVSPGWPALRRAMTWEEGRKVVADGDVMHFRFNN
jgi:hypothetical protein